MQRFLVTVVRVMAPTWGLVTQGDLQDVPASVPPEGADLPVYCSLRLPPDPEHIAVVRAHLGH